MTSPEPTTPEPTTPEPTPSPDEPSPSPDEPSPSPEPTEPAPTTQPAAPPASPTPAASPTPDGGATTAPPPPPAPTAADGTSAAIASLLDVIARGQDSGQLTGKAPRALTERVTAVAERLASGDDDRVDKAQDDVRKLREEFQKQVDAGEVGQGVANQLSSDIDDLDSLLA